MDSKEFLYSATRLWKYLNIYFLKPFDAVNDTLTSTILHQLEWKDSFYEVGSGDGMFSFIMHGGSFPLSFDRYLLTDTKLSGDIYDYHKESVLKTKSCPNKPRLIQCFDAKLSHIRKVQEIGYAENSSVVSYEKLPVIDCSLDFVFFYTPHGLKDHGDAIREISRVLTSEGKLLILVYDKSFKNDFISYRIGKAMNGIVGKYFKRLDSGRYKEIIAMSRSRSEWRALFKECGLIIEDVQSGLSGLAWRMYDIQTRPILKPLISIFNFLPVYLRTLVKVSWMIVVYPILLLFYLISSNRLIRSSRYDCYIAYQLKKK